MSDILIRNVLLNNSRTNVRIKGNAFEAIAPDLTARAGEFILDGSSFAILPGFYNTHTHAAMTLLRGYADDMALFTWLQEHIWPAEAKLTEEEIRIGCRLAMIEMIHSGTVFFNDMYYRQPEMIEEAAAMGMRGAVGLMFMDVIPEESKAANERTNARLLELRGNISDRIDINYAPHSIYTVQGLTLRKVAEEAKARGMMIHIHAAETETEVKNCLKEHRMRPVEYLDSLGILGPKTVLAHAVHLTDAECALVAERGAVLAHMPCSNMKLVSGAFRYRQCCDAAYCRVTIGTDGASSNNTLSMLNEMRFAALLAKHESGEPTVASARQIFDIATRNGADAFGINGGVIEPGRLADCILVNLDHPVLCAGHNLVSDMVYAADSSCIDTVICDGRILMRGGKIDGEEEVVKEMKRVCRIIRERR